MSEIVLPPDAPRRGRPVRDPDDYGDGFISIEDAETLAQSTGQFRGMTVEFSDDGLEWVEAWVPSADVTHPTHARAIVLRKHDDGEVVPTRVVVRWDEFVPGETDSLRPFWDKKPTVMLGKVAKVTAYRGGFRDVIGNRYEPAEFHQTVVAA